MILLIESCQLLFISLCTIVHPNYHGNNFYKMVIEYGSSELGIQSDFGRYLLATYNMFVLLATLVGDSIILIATIKYNAIKLNKVHIVIMQHLAVADLVMSVFFLFPNFVAMTTNRWILGEVMCFLDGLIKFWLYSVVLSLTCTLTTTKLLTVKFPFYSRIWSAKSAHCVCLSTWVASLLNLAGFLDYLSSSDYFPSFSYLEYSCFIRVKHQTMVPLWLYQLRKAVSSIHIFLILAVIITSLLLVLEAKRTASRNNRAVRWEGILTVILTGAVVVVSFGPFALIWTLSNLGIRISVPSVRAATVLYNLNIVANFFIYAMTVQSFRKFLKKKFSAIIHFANSG